MDFTISKTEKESVEKLIHTTNPTIKKINAIKKRILFGGLSVAVVYVLLNLFIPSWSVAEINGVMAKDYEMIIMFAILMVVPAVVVSFLTGRLAKELSKNYTLARVNESLAINGSELKYLYRDVRNTLPKERMAVEVDLSRVKNVVWNSTVKSLEFAGDINVTFYTDYKNDVRGREGVADSFVIYDYFKPSLKATLEDKGVKITEKR